MGQMKQQLIEDMNIHEVKELLIILILIMIMDI